MAEDSTNADGVTTLLTGDPEGDKGSEDKGSEDKGSEDKGSEDKGSEDKGSEDKGSEDKSSEDKGSEDKPVEYEDFKAPEGMELNQEVLGTFKTFATENKLSQEQAQAAVDMGVKLVQDAVAQQQEAFKAQRKEWNAAAKADPEFGRDNLTENLVGGKAVLEKYGSKELISFLAQSGIGDHPEMIRLLVNVHKATKEDTLPPGSQKPAPGSKSATLTYGASDHK